MGRLIDADAAIDALRDYLVEKRCPDDGTLTCRLIENEVINKLPPVQPERKTGRWIPVTNGRGGHQCDKCGCYAPSYRSGAEWLSNFCPECNADMRGEQDGNSDT